MNLDKPLILDFGSSEDTPYERDVINKLKENLEVLQKDLKEKAKELELKNRKLEELRSENYKIHEEMRQMKILQKAMSEKLDNAEHQMEMIKKLMNEIPSN